MWKWPWEREELHFLSCTRVKWYTAHFGGRTDGAMEEGKKRENEELIKTSRRLGHISECWRFISQRKERKGIKRQKKEQMVTSNNLKTGWKNESRCGCGCLQRCVKGWIYVCVCLWVFYRNSNIKDCSLLFYCKSVCSFMCQSLLCDSVDSAFVQDFHAVLHLHVFH